jgi:hypothetical protein
MDVKASYIVMITTALRIAYVFHSKIVLAPFVYAVKIAFQSKRKSQAFGNIKNAKNNR